MKYKVNILSIIIKEIDDALNIINIKFNSFKNIVN